MGWEIILLIITFLFIFIGLTLIFFPIRIWKLDNVRPLIIKWSLFIAIFIVTSYSIASLHYATNYGNMFIEKVQIGTYEKIYLTEVGKCKTPEQKLAFYQWYTELQNSYLLSFQEYYNEYNENFYDNFMQRFLFGWFKAQETSVLKAVEILNESKTKLKSICTN